MEQQPGNNNNNINNNNINNNINDINNDIIADEINENGNNRESIREEAPVALFEKREGLLDQFAEFNKLTGNNTRMVEPNKLFEEFEKNFEAFKELGKDDQEIARTEFQNYFNNFYLANLSATLKGTLNSKMDNKPTVLDIVSGYSKLMSAMYDALKDENFIISKAPEFTFGNLDPKVIMQTVTKDIDSLDLKTREERMEITNQLNEFTLAIDSYKTKYFNKLSTIDKITARPSSLPAPIGFESNKLDDAIGMFNEKVGENPIFSNKEAFIEEVKKNFNEYQKMIGKEDFTLEDAQKRFKEEYLDKVAQGQLQLIAQEQCKLDEDYRIPPAEIIDLYKEVQNQLIEALIEEKYITKEQGAKTFGSFTGKEICEAITKGYEQGNMDIESEEFQTMMKPVESKLVEYEKNEYPELPSEQDIKENVSKETKAEKAEYNFEKDFINELKAFEQVTHIHLELDQVKEEFDRIKAIPKDANITDKNVEKKVLANAYSNFYKTNLSNALYVNIGNVNNGTSFLGPQAIAQSFDRLMLAIDVEAKKAGIIGNDYVRDTPETVSAETKYAETLRFSTTPKDRKEAKIAYQKARALQSKNVEDSLHKEILALNAALGLKFSSKGIIDHLASQFKDVKSGEIEDMKSEFPKKYETFLKAAYENMLGKHDMSQDIPMAEKTKAFDQFTQKLENVLKQKGWLDMDHRHELNGGLNPDYVKTAQMNELKKRPQTTQAEAENKIETENMKDVRTELESLTDKVPEIDKNGMNAVETNTAVNYLRAIDKRHGARGFFNMLRHPVTYYREYKTMQVVTDKLAEKGYLRQDLENLIKNPMAENVDPIAKKRKEEIDSINKEYDSATNVNKMDSEADKLLENTPEMDFRKRIEVPECNNKREISGQDGSKLSQKIELDKNIEKKKEEGLDKK